jgi:hypothetical protein
MGEGDHSAGSQVAGDHLRDRQDANAVLRARGQLLRPAKPGEDDREVDGETGPVGRRGYRAYPRGGNCVNLRLKGELPAEVF